MNSLRVIAVALCYVVVVFGVLLPFFSDAKLSPSFYTKTCPNVSSNVHEVIRNVSKTDPRMLASLIRLHFHDCFVQGCDASVLLNNTTTIESEQEVPPNKNSIRGLDVINKIKTNLESSCPNTVSCSDILTLAAQSSSVLAHGPYWKVPLGRRDSFTANQSLASMNLPSPSSNLTLLKSKFAAQGLNTVDFVNANSRLVAKVIVDSSEDGAGVSS